MAGESAERQENGIVKAVTDAVKANKGSPITVVAGKTKIAGVISARKASHLRQQGGSEPYIDILLGIDGEKDELGLSCKGKSAPSLAGGGLSGLELAVPGIAKKFMKAAYNYLTKTMKLNPGDKVPDVYGKIGAADKVKIVVGNKKMGGPIDYMFVGVMDVNAKYDEEKNELTFRDTEITPAKKYAEDHELYFRLRARREDQRFDPNAKDRDGSPKIYGKSPSKGDSAGRIVVQDKTPSNAVIVSL
jgi:hypothetical protein